MRSIEDFMRNYFAARIAQEKRELLSRAEYRQRFYTPDCFFESREATVEMIASEHIISLTVSDETADIVTAFTNPLLKSSEPQKQRYRLTKSADGWRIHEVQSACYSCHGKSGNGECMLCKGTGWLSLQFRKGQSSDSVG